uniref:Uncharacterized protein n=1 Tax=Lutzomyia longipalpis TaxID=7200 RepID=A0A7G3B400_LUTLO
MTCCALLLDILDVQQRKEIQWNVLLRLEFDKSEISHSVSFGFACGVIEILKIFSILKCHLIARWDCIIVKEFPKFVLRHVWHCVLMVQIICKIL